MPDDSVVTAYDSVVVAIIFAVIVSLIVGVLVGWQAASADADREVLTGRVRVNNGVVEHWHPHGKWGNAGWWDKSR